MAGKINNPSVLPSASHRLGGASPEQWGIPKFAGGKEPTGLFARMRLLTPYTGEAKIR